jgi:hypothetical protein
MLIVGKGTKYLYIILLKGFPDDLEGLFRKDVISPPVLFFYNNTGTPG